MLQRLTKLKLKNIGLIIHFIQVTNFWKSDRSKKNISAYLTELQDLKTKYSDLKSLVLMRLVNKIFIDDINISVFDLI